MEVFIKEPEQLGLETQYNRISGQTNITYLDTIETLRSYLRKRCPDNLTVIRISGARISDIAGVQFRENLTEINLSYNAITTLVGAQFPEGLRKLDLGYNSIQKLDGIHFPPNLTELLLNNNKIDSMSRVIFPVGLITLDLSNHADDGPNRNNRNQIKSFNEVRFPNQLTELNLHDNPLETLGSIIDPFPATLDLIERQFPKIVRKYRQGATSKQISDLNQLSLHNQLRALTSFLREGMEHRSKENNERLKDDPNVIFVDAPNGVKYNVPLRNEPIQYILDYMNDNYYISSLYPNCDVMILVKKSEVLDLIRHPAELNIGHGTDLVATPRNMQLAGGRTQKGKNKTHKKRWSMKYKRSINCRRPRGFSQRQHCKYGRGKSNPARD